MASYIHSFPAEVTEGEKKHPFPKIQVKPYPFLLNGPYQSGLVPLRFGKHA